MKSGEHKDILGVAPGFQPFFLCAGLVAVGIMAVWLLAYTKRDPLLTYYGSSGWHAHEMLFGYMTAVIAGLLLSMAGNVVGGSKIPFRPSLILLMMLWLAGRALPVLPAIPPLWVALVDMAFLPVLLFILIPVMLRGRQRHNYFVMPLLGMLICANALVHSEWLGYTMDTARLGVVLAVYVMTVLLVVIIGRLIHARIARTAGAVPPRRRWFIEYGAVFSVIVLGLADLFSPRLDIVVACAVIAALIHAWRWIGWVASRAWTDAQLWALLLGYAWLVAGMALLALAYSGIISGMIVFHAIMVGGFGGLTLGVMVQLIMVYNGRVQQIGSIAVLSFVVLNVAALVRIVGPLWSLRYEQAAVTASGALWIVSFVLFLLASAPLLIQTRTG